MGLGVPDRFDRILGMVTAQEFATRASGSVAVLNRPE